MSDGAALTSDGRAFHVRAADTGNALSPSVEQRVTGTTSVMDTAERRRTIPSTRPLPITTLDRVHRLGRRSEGKSSSKRITLYDRTVDRISVVC